MRLQSDHIRSGTAVIAGILIDFDRNGQTGHVADEVAQAASSIPGFWVCDGSDPAPVLPAAEVTTFTDAIIGHKAIAGIPGRVHSAVRRALQGFTDESFTTPGIDEDPESPFPDPPVRARKRRGKE